MIDFRYHVVSIVAVFLALALGLFIGSTTLRGKVGANISSRAESVAHKNSQLQGQLQDAQSQIARAEAFDASLTPYAVANRLAGESVVVVSAPGVDETMRSDVLDALTAAGANVDGDVRLQDTLLDPAQDAFLGTLADRVAVNGHPLPNTAGAVRALALLSEVLMSKGQGAPVPHNAATKVLSAFSAGKLLTTNGDPPQPASLAVVLAAPAPSSKDAAAAAQQQALLATLVRDLDRDGVGAVVAGPASADADGGLLDVVRGDKSLRTNVSTVDSVDLPSGVIATVLAAAEQASGKAGSYGTGSGADAPLPSPSPS